MTKIVRNFEIVARNLLKSRGHSPCAIPVDCHSNGEQVKCICFTDIEVMPCNLLGYTSHDITNEKSSLFRSLR